MRKEGNRLNIDQKSLKIERKTCLAPGLHPLLLQLRLEASLTAKTSFKRPKSSLFQQKTSKNVRNPLK